MKVEAATSTRLYGRWLFIARAAWVVLVLLMLGAWLVGMVTLIREPLPDCIAVPCDPVDLNARDLQMAEELDLPTAILGAGFTSLASILMGTSYFVIAGLIFWRKSDDWMGLLVSFMLVFLGAVFFTSGDDAFLRTHPDFVPLREVLSLIGILCVFTLFFIFPDGRFVPRRWKWPVFILIAGAALLGYAPVTRDFFDLLFVVLFISLIALAASAQVYRYFRVSTPAEQQQTKWVLLGLMGSLALVATWLILAVLYPPDQPSASRIYALLVTAPLIGLFALMLPVSLALSIFRYRLWDIDLVIRRTLVYGLLTVLLLFIYFGSVILLQEIFATATSQRSAVAIVISTLLIAALFAPLRRRIQTFIDRRFYRRKYDAARTLTQFGRTAREEVELEALTAELVRVVQETMQPEQVSLWLPGPYQAEKKIEEIKSR